MNQHYFTSDLHFYHKNILKFCDRPVGEQTNEEWLYDQIRAIPDGSNFWHLGDLSFSHAKLEEILVFLMVDKKLKLHLITGNHDNKQAIQRAITKIMEQYRGQVTPPILRDYYEISSDHMLAILGHGYKERLGITADKVVLFHFPIEEWNKCHRGALHFHGHCHGNLNGDTIVNRIDVGIDSIGKIMTLEEVIGAIKEQNKTAKREPTHH